MCDWLRRSGSPRISTRNSDVRYGGRQEVALEGFADMDPDAFVVMWLLAHGGASSLTWSELNQRYFLKPGMRTPCRRIEWRYSEGTVS